MPIKNQQAVIDDDTMYTPPPNAYPDPHRKSTVRVAPLHSQTRTAELAQQAQHVWDSLRGRAQQSLERAAERAEQRRVERITQREQEQPKIYRQAQATQYDYEEELAVDSHFDKPITVQNLSWHQLFYVYSVLLSLFADVWLLDGFFTVLGFIQIGMPINLPFIGAAAGFHLLASWGQRSLIYDPSRLIKCLGFFLLGVNIFANIAGIRLVIELLAPGYLGTLPIKPWEWIIIFTQHLEPSIMGKGFSLPSWWPAALLISLLAGGLAWFAEPNLSLVHRRWRAIYQQRQRR